MKLLSLILLVGSFTAFSTGAFSQSTPPIPTSTSAPTKHSELLAQNLANFDPQAEFPREKREQAYTKMFEAQRNIYRMNLQRTRSGLSMYADLARAALLSSLQLFPGLSEAYVSLAEISLVTSPDLDEARSLCTLAVRLNKNSIGGHKCLARILTKQSGLRSMTIDKRIVEKAIVEWTDVVRLDPRSAEALAMLGELYERTGRPTEAVDPFRKWIAASSPLDTVWFQIIVGGRPEELAPDQAPQRLAGVLIRLGRTQEAVNVLCQLLSDDPDNSDVMAQIQEAVETTDSDQIAKVIDPIRQVVLANPRSLGLIAFFASLDSKSGNIDDAVKMLTSTINALQTTDRPAAANLQLTVGDIYLASGRFAEAGAAYEKAFVIRGLEQAVTLDPEEREFAMTAFDKLITAYKRSNRIDDAKAAVQRARKLLGKDDLFSDRELISLYRETGNRSEALMALRDARTRNSEDVALLRLEATLLTETGQIDKAVDIIKQRLEVSSNNTRRVDDEFSNYLFISQLYNTAGRNSDSILAAKQAFTVAGSSERQQIAQLMMATAYQTAGKFDEAESILHDVLKASPRNPIALNNLGYFLLQRDRNVTDALDLIKEAIAIDPNNPSYLDSLGWAYFKLGRIDDAVRTLEQANRLDDTSASIQEHLGDAYRSKGNLELARHAWQKASILISGPSDIARLKGKLENLK